jgi:hypothetical protein
MGNKKINAFNHIGKTKDLHIGIEKPIKRNPSANKGTYTLL